MDTLGPFRRYFRYAALACSLASATLTAMFGFGQSEYVLVAAACALFLVACSLASDYINLFVVDAWRGQRWGLLGVFSVGAVFVFSLNLLSNLGSVGWQRDSVIKQAVVQNTRFDDTRAVVAENKQSLAMWKDRLAKLEAEHAWAATVTADGLRSQLASATEAIRQEERRGGCGPKCLALMQSKADLERKIAVAEEAGEARRRIEATQKVLLSYRDRSAGQEIKVAAPESQAKFFASMATVSLAPTADAQTWTDRGIASWLALGLCVAPILFGLIGWKTDGTGPGVPAPHETAGPGAAYLQPVNNDGASLTMGPASRTNEPTIIHTVEQWKDERLAAWAKSPAAQQFLAAAA